MRYWLLQLVAAARQRLAEVPGVAVLDGAGVDPAKLVVLLAGAGADGYAVEADLIAAGMPVELGDRDMIVPIITLADNEDTVARFVAALVAIIERHRGPPRRLETVSCVVGVAGDGDPAARGVLRGERDRRGRYRRRQDQRRARGALPAGETRARPRRGQHERRPAAHPRQGARAGSPTRDPTLTTFQVITKGGQ